MQFNIEFVKKRWPQILAALLGVLVLYYLIKHFSRGAGSADYSAGVPVQVTNPQDTSYAQLTASLASTAAQVSIANTRTAAQLTATLDSNSSAVSIQRLQSEAEIKNTALQGETLLGLADTQAAVQKRQLDTVASQVGTLLRYSKHFSTDIRAIAPVFALETRQPQAAPALADSYAHVAVANSPGATVGAVAGGISRIFGGLFG